MNTGTMRAQGVCKSFGKKAVLRELELTLEPGKIYGLLGRNGAGKTTLLSILTAQLAPERGSVTYGGEPVWENQAALDHLCFAREAPAAGQTSLRLGHYLRSAAIFYPGWDEGYAHRLLEEFCLDPSRKLSQLSRGQLSMVSVLTALASRAGLTLLDEPTAGLDAVAREQFYRLLLEDFSHTGRTFVLSTHIIGEAAPLFEEVLILNGGRITEHGPTDELLEQFRTVSGPAEQTEAACRELTVLSLRDVGRRRLYTVRGTPEQLEALDASGLDTAPMELQEVFTALCGQTDAAGRRGHETHRPLSAVNPPALAVDPAHLRHQCRSPAPQARRRGRRPCCRPL